MNWKRNILIAFGITIVLELILYAITLKYFNVGPLCKMGGPCPSPTILSNLLQYLITGIPIFLIALLILYFIEKIRKK